jgi:Skp family chaperone for outer membrane proteins
MGKSGQKGKGKGTDPKANKNNLGNFDKDKEKELAKYQKTLEEKEKEIKDLKKKVSQADNSSTNDSQWNNSNRNSNNNSYSNNWSDKSWSYDKSAREPWNGKAKGKSNSEPNPVKTIVTPAQKKMKSHPEIICALMNEEVIAISESLDLSPQQLSEVLVAISRTQN